MTNADDNASADDVNMKDASHPPSGVESASDAAHHRASPMKQQQLIREDDHPSIASSVSQEEDEEEEQREEAEDKGKERSEDGDDGDDDDEDMRGGDQQPDDKRGRKSYKRKFAKHKIRFELAMGECTELFKEEARIRDLSKRLKQQNDQLLEVLAELNSSIHVPPDQRFDLESDPQEPHVPRLDHLHPSPDLAILPKQDYSKDAAMKLLDRARDDMLNDRISPAEGLSLERSLLRTNTHAPKGSYARLKNTVVHTTITDAGLTNIGAVNEDGICDEEFTRLNGAFELESTLGFLTPEAESAYLAALDHGHSKILDGPSSSRDREKEAAIRNPLSVYNWLKKHQPQALFSNGNGPSSTANTNNPANAGKGKDPAGGGGTATASAATEKDKDSTAPAGTKSHAPSRTLASRASKSRASLQSAALAAQTDDYIEGAEDLDTRDVPATTSTGNANGNGGNEGGVGGGNRSKRKRDDDTGYRPKGGNGGKTAKKRREDAAKRAARRASFSTGKTTGTGTGADTGPASGPPTETRITEGSGQSVDVSTGGEVGGEVGEI